MGKMLVPTSPWFHYAGDAAAWLAGLLAGWWQYRRWPHAGQRLAGVTRPSYFVVLGLGALGGAWLIGSGNSLRSAIALPSHSIAGGLAGGIVAVELWKAFHGVRQSTGEAFVLPISVGIAVGRMGCFFSGLADYTYGIPTDLPWAVDLGDNITRHPVQIYEALAMACFAATYVIARSKGFGWATHHAFHAMIIVYAAQRFVWEFLKPYPTLVGPLNIFHLLMGVMVVYGLSWWRRSDDRRAGG